MTFTARGVKLKCGKIEKIVPDKDYVFNPDTGAIVRIGKKRRLSKKERRAERFAQRLAAKK